MLSDITIKEYLLSNKIKIFPEFHLDDVRPAGVRLHLGKELLRPIQDQRVDLDSAEEIQFERIDISEKEFVLRPNEFILGSTLEKFQVTRDLVCHIDGRSTVARIGLAIHCTSGVIDGNFEEARSVVLEMKNLGPFNIVLRYKMTLAMLSFHQLTTEIGQNAQEQYRGQEGVLAPNLRLQKR